MTDKAKLPELRLNKADIRGFIASLKEEGMQPDTVKKYERALGRLYLYLPAGKLLSPEVLQTYISEMKRDYSISSLNVTVSAFNGFLRFMDRADLCLKPLPEVKKQGAELTNREYLCLLNTARQRNMRQSYLLVKLFGNTELGVRDIAALTVKAIRENTIRTVSGRTIRLPQILKDDLLAYAKDENILGGPIFRTSSGRAYGREMVHQLVSCLSEPANISPEKVNPRSLHKLYLEEQRRSIEKLEQLLQSDLDIRLKAEQSFVAWDGSLEPR